MYIYNVILAIKNNEILSFAATWVDLENTIPSKVCQTEKDKYHMLSPICGILKNNANESIHKTKTDSLT